MIDLRARRVFFFCVSRPARALISAVGGKKQTNKRFRHDKFAAAASSSSSSHQIIDIPALAHTTSTVEARVDPTAA